MDVDYTCELAMRQKKDNCNLSACFTLSPNRRTTSAGPQLGHDRV